MSDTNNALSLSEQLKALAALRAEQRQRAAAVGIAPVALATGRTHDALGGVIGAGTHAMHRVLAEAYAEGVSLNIKEIIKLSGYTNAPNHRQTMATKGKLVNDGRGLWRLSDAAGQLWHGAGKAFGFASPAEVTPPETPMPTPGELPAEVETGGIGQTGKKRRK